MTPVRLVREEEKEVSTLFSRVSPASSRVWAYIGVSALLLAMIGTWLVWFSAYIQRSLQEEDIRSSCRRAMPDTAERCFDTVVIQRGGIRR